MHRDLSRTDLLAAGRSIVADEIGSSQLIHSRWWPAKNSVDERCHHIFREDGSARRASESNRLTHRAMAAGAFAQGTCCVRTGLRGATKSGTLFPEGSKSCTFGELREAATISSLEDQTVS